jgi:hypothetical protein
LLLQQALKTTGLKDDTTCVVVDIIPSDHGSTSAPSSPKHNENKLRSLLFGRRSHSSVGKLGNKKKSASFGFVEELFEEGSAMLEERHVLILLLQFILLFYVLLVSVSTRF